MSLTPMPSNGISQFSGSWVVTRRSRSLTPALKERISQVSCKTSTNCLTTISLEALHCCSRFQIRSTGSSPTDHLQPKQFRLDSFSDRTHNLPVSRTRDHSIATRTTMLCKSVLTSASAQVEQS